MHLLSIDQSGELRLTKRPDDKRPPYAVLSHTWGDEVDELTFKDVQDGLGKSKAGFQKVMFCGHQAQKDDLFDFWVDSCCINRSDSSELSESIISMFRWYKQAAKCYVYLSDVTALKRGNNGDTACNWRDAFRKSRWFTRGWTLQELLAPKEVEFWSRDGQRLGTKQSLKDLIHEITEIPVRALCGAPLSDFSVNERHRWAAKRDTTRKEDKAYCLLGIFDVFMPPMYGEGDHASQRLQDKIKLRFGDIQSGNGHRTGSNSETLKGHRESVLASLQFEQMDTRRYTVKDAQQRTCGWMVQHPAYVAWRLKEGCSQDQRTLWIAGKPGAGKSTIMKYLYNNTNQSKHDDEIVISFFFNARGDELEKTTVGMYRALLAQILAEVQDLQKILDGQEPSSGWTIESLKRIFADAINGLGGKRLTCFIDALDECDEQQIRDMVEFFDDLQDGAQGDSNGFFMCFASRHYPTIEIHNGQRLVLEDEDGHSEDLWMYIRRRLNAGKGDLVDDIQAQVHEKANGVFMWVVLVVNILNEEFSRGRIFAVKHRLKEIPGGLSDLFRDLLRRDNVNLNDLLLCIQWILFARRPLSMPEFYFAMVAGLYPEEVPEAWNQREVTTDYMRLFIQSSSKGLAELTKSKTAPQVQFIHESVSDFLLKDGGLQELWPDLGQGEQLYSNSHERLKQCCLHQITADFSSLTLKYPGPLPKAKSEEARKLRRDMCAAFPFLAYASSELLLHANEAAHTIGQASFLAEFSLDRWVHLNNIYEVHQVRRHTSDVTLLYVLAEKGLDRLVRAIGSFDLWQRIPNEKYQYPLLAAICCGHKSTLCALLGSAQNIFADAIESDPGFGKASQPLKTADMLLWAIEHGNWSFAEYLLLHGHRDTVCTDPLKRKYNSDDALSLSARHGKMVLLRLLLQCQPKRAFSQSVNLRPIYLISACEGGHMEAVQLLLDHGAQVNAEHCESTSPSYYHTALEAASAEDHECIVELLINRGVSDFAKQSALATALRAGRIRSTTILLQRGARLGREIMCSALLAAAASGHQEMFELLAEHGPAVDLPINSVLRIAIRQASVKGDKDIVKLLLDRVEISGDALLDACDNGSEQMVQFLLDNGADVNARDPSGQTALQAACCRGYNKTVQLLLNHGADVNARGPSNDAALEAACAAGHETVVWLLLNHNADLNVCSGQLSSALEAAYAAGHGTIVQLLLNRIADLNNRGQQLSCALEAACAGGHGTVVRLLLDRDADLNVHSQQLNSALEAACAAGHETIVRLLLDRDADLNVLGRQLSSALEVACAAGHNTVARLLLCRSAGLHTDHKSVGAALREACISGHETVVRLLLDYGIDPNMSCGPYGTALRYAEMFGNQKVFRLLVERGAFVYAEDSISRC